MWLLSISTSSLPFTHLLKAGYGMKRHLTTPMFPETTQMEKWNCELNRAWVRKIPNQGEPLPSCSRISSKLKIWLKGSYNNCSIFRSLYCGFTHCNAKFLEKLCNSSNGSSSCPGTRGKTLADTNLVLRQIFPRPRKEFRATGNLSNQRSCWKYASNHMLQKIFMMSLRLEVWVIVENIICHILHNNTLKDC